MGTGPLDFEPGDDPARRRAEEDWRRLQHRQDPDEDAVGVPPSGPPPPKRRAPSRQTTGFLTIVLAAIVLIAVLNGASSEGPGSRGLEAGDRAAVFAAPSALGRLDGDVNVAEKAGQGDAGKVPACSVQGPDVVNACALWRKGPTAIAFFATRGGDECVRQMDALQDARPRHPGVTVVGIAIRGDKGDVADLQRDRGWTYPVGFDRDGVLANLYGVAVCPQITYVRQGGEVAGTSIGELDAAELDARLTALEAGRPLP